LDQLYRTHDYNSLGLARVSIVGAELASNKFESLRSLPDPLRLIGVLRCFCRCFALERPARAGFGKGPPIRFGAALKKEVGYLLVVRFAAADLSASLGEGNQ